MSNAQHAPKSTPSFSVVKGRYEPPKLPTDPLEQHHAILAEEMRKQVDEILDVHLNGPKKQRVCTTGLSSVDQLIGGWMPGQTYVIAGKTGAGKTSFATHSAMMLALAAEQMVLPPILFFSLEMTQKDMSNRAIAWFTDTPQDLVQRAGFEKVLNDEQVAAVEIAKKFTSDKIRTICTTDASISTIREHARRFHKQHGVSAIICDYIGLIEPESGSKTGTREREVATSSRGMKAMAVELDVPVLVLSQLGRAAEKADEPYLGLLRESGTIECDASTVLFLWPSKQRSIDGFPCVDVVAAKRRFGAPWEKKTVKFLGAFGRFEDLDGPIDPSPGNDWHDAGGVE